MRFYLLRRLLSAIPLLLGVNLITFMLFFMVNSPDDVARMHLGQKHVTQQAIERWQHQFGYDLPLFWNSTEHGTAQLKNTLFFTKSIQLFFLHFGRSDSGRSIAVDIKTRMWPSLAIALPTLILGLLFNIIFASWIVLFRQTLIDTSAMIFCVILISISSLFYIIAGQYLFAKILLWVPISGYDEGIHFWRFILLPVFISVISGLGSGARWYRSLFLEEVSKDYVRTARAKGLSEWRTLTHHVLPNALLPIITGVVVIIPSLFMGSLILESFFGIPGLGSYVIESIQNQDFAVVRAMVFLGTLLYLIGLIMTDIAYTLADPRVKLL
jgi:peptide/nickel transport system permease protein